MKLPFNLAKFKSSATSSNSQQALWFGISSFSRFLIAILSSVILSRYFSKEEYGTYKQIVFVYSTFITLFAAGLPSAYAYFLPKLSRSEGKGIVNRLTKLFIGLGIVYGLSLFFLSGIIADALKNPELERGLKLFAVIPLLMMPTLGVSGVYTAIRKTYVLALYTTVTRLGMLAMITLPVILLKGTYETAIIGWIFSSALTLLAALYMKYRPFRGVRAVVNTVSDKNIFKYSLPIMVAALSGVVLKFADQFFLSRYFGTEVFADYSNGFIPMPFITMITGATHAVFIPLFSGLMEKENGKAAIAKHWKSGVNKVIILIFPLLVFFMFYAKEVIYILYGPLYDKSYIYFRLAMIINLGSPFLFYSILLATGKTRIYAMIHIVYAIAIWGLGFVVCNIGSTPYQYLILSVCLAIISRFVGLIFAARTIEAGLKQLIDLTSIFKLLLASILIGLLTKELIGLFTERASVIFLMGGALYAGLMYLIDKRFRLRILDTALSFVRRKSSSNGQVKPTFSSES